MTWIKLDDNFPDHHKIAGLSDSGFRLYIEMICYCNRLLTDGYIKKSALDKLDKGIIHLELVDAKLLDLTTDGVYIRSYDEWQTLKSDVERKRRQGNARVTALRSRGSNADVTLPETETKTKADTYTDTFNEFWDAYPRKQAKAAAFKSWLVAIRKAEPTAIIQAAKRYADDPNRVDQFTAHASTWLNQGRWEDAPLPSRINPKIDTTPTWQPPVFSADDQPEGVAMPDDVKELINKIRFNGLE